MRNPNWQKLAQHAVQMDGVEMRQLFNADPQRFEHFSIQSDSLLFDFSKNRITQQTLDLLYQLASAAELPCWREKMFSGEKINHTEQRAVLHTALRNPADSKLGQVVTTELTRMEQLCNKLHSGQWLGYTGKPLKEVVVIGIGGSYLGPKLACEALSHFTQGDINVHFVANVDAHVIDEVCNTTSPQETLFVIISKSFTTQETLINAQTAATWLQQHSDSNTCIQNQFLAITANAKAARSFGIEDQHILNMWDWVGGRYSLWSAVGFPIALQIGMDHFRQLLAGAYAMDEHFKNAPMQENLPITMALLGIWYINFLHLPHHAVLPYDHRLHSLPAYLQQLDMESNGKKIDREGNVIDYASGPVIFGEAGTNGQHAFCQLLHQGSTVVPCDFIGFSKVQHEHDDHHEVLLANMLAQAQALMLGRSIEETLALLKSKDVSYAQALAPHMTFPGNRPSNTLLCKSLTPTTLGALLALYEHKIFVQGVIWNINSFDQMGVELGKTLTPNILTSLHDGTELPEGDSSTQALIQHIRNHRQ